MGGFMIAEVARLIKENKKKLPFGLYITNSVQEEIGLRGAEMITHTIQPDVAIVTDVTHDTTTPMIDKKKEGFLSTQHTLILLGDSVFYNNPYVEKGKAVNDLLQKNVDENTTIICLARNDSTINNVYQQLENVNIDLNDKNLMYVGELITKYDKERSENQINYLAKKNQIAQLQITKNNE